jgi:RimJ/RimL family protein N-acetyltransferase
MSPGPEPAGISEVASRIAGEPVPAGQRTRTMKLAGPQRRRSGMMRLMAVLLSVPAAGRRSALLLRPWLRGDMPALVAEMGREYPAWGLWPGPTDQPVQGRWTGPRDEREAAGWLASQDRGWREGSWLAFAVLEQGPTPDIHRLAGHVALNREQPTERPGAAGTAEVSYWTAVTARGHGVATAALRAVTTWAFDHYSGGGLRRIKLVHPLANQASCRVAEKSGYTLKAISPARPPLWFQDGHIHLRTADDSRE